MLLRRIFEEGLVEIEITFSNFEMTKKRADIWYKYSKYLTDDQWKEKIKDCLCFCRKIPTLADILDLKGYYKSEKDWSEVKVFEEDNYKYKSIPTKIKEQIHKVLNIPDKDKSNKDAKNRN